MLTPSVFYCCIFAAVDAFEGSIKVVAGNFSTYTPGLADENSPEYKEMANKVISAVRSASKPGIRGLTQQDGGKTQDGRMTKKRGERLCIAGLMRYFYTSFGRPESYSRPVA